MRACPNGKAWQTLLRCSVVGVWEHVTFSAPPLRTAGLRCGSTLASRQRTLRFSNKFNNYSIDCTQPRGILPRTSYISCSFSWSATALNTYVQSMQHAVGELTLGNPCTCSFRVQYNHAAAKWKAIPNPKLMIPREQCLEPPGSKRMQSKECNISLTSRF